MVFLYFPDKTVHIEQPSKAKRSDIRLKMVLRREILIYIYCRVTSYQVEACITIL